MTIKNLFNCYAEVKSVEFPSWELVKGFEINSNEKDYEELDRLSNDIEFSLRFYDLTDDFLLGNLSFFVTIHKKEKYGFETTPLFETNDVKYDNLINNHYTFKVSSKLLNLDGEFLFKLYFKVNHYPNSIIDTEPHTLLKSLNKKLGCVNNDDWYKSLTYAPTIPQISLNDLSNNTLDTLKTHSFITDASLTSMLIPFTYSGNIMLSIDGITMSETLDYTIENNIILFKDSIPKNSVINITYSGKLSNNGIEKDSFYLQEKVINDQKVEGTIFIKDGFFMIYLNKFIAKNHDPIVIINGVILSKDLDYSIDSSNQIIKLNGKLIQYDIVDVYYTAEFNTLNTTKNLINGVLKIDNPIEQEEGKFQLTISRTVDFKDLVGTIDIDYITGNSLYEFTINIMEKGLFYIKIASIKNVKILKEIKQIVVEGNTLKININS